MAPWLITLLIILGVCLLLGLIYLLVLIRPRARKPANETLLCDYAHRGLHGGEIPENSLTAFEKACDDAQNAFLQRAMLIPFGPEPVLAFVAAREQEMRNVRIIISGKLAKLPASTIRERMREAYV